MISFTKCYKEATDEQRAGLILDSAFMAEVEQLKKAYNGEVILQGDPQFIDILTPPLTADWIGQS